MVSIALVVIAPLLSLWTLLSRRHSLQIWQQWFRLMCRVIGIQIVIKGHVPPGPTLFVANHISYLDIPILGAFLPAYFIAKADVRRWPLIGWFAQAQGTLFISRKRQKIPSEKKELQSVFAKGKSLILFPEGTTGDGVSVLPFKSSFFDMASDPSDTFKIQPISLIYHQLSGRPLGRFFRKVYGWPGTTSLLPHLLQILRLGNVTATIFLHHALDPRQFSSRKVLAHKAWELVASGAQSKTTATHV